MLSWNSQLDFHGFNKSIEFEINDINMKTKIVVRPAKRAPRFDEKSFLKTILGFNPHWDYEHYNESISEKNYKFRYTTKDVMF